jgi:hypothetical protein
MSATEILNSAKTIGSDTAPAILRIRASSAQRSLCPQITSALNIYIYSKHEKKPKSIKGLEGMYSLKRLSEIISFWNRPF